LGAALVLLMQQEKLEALRVAVAEVLLLETKTCLVHRVKEVLEATQVKQLLVGNLLTAVLVVVAQEIPVCRLMVDIITLEAMVGTDLLLTFLEPEQPTAVVEAVAISLVTLAAALQVVKLPLVAQGVAVMAVQAAQDHLMEPLVLQTQVGVVEQVAAREVLVQVAQVDRVL
jgi:hypothetical protein